MEFELARKLEELELNDLVELLTKIRIEDRDTFNLLKELIEDL